MKVPLEKKLITHEFKLDDLSAAIEQATDVDHALNVIIEIC